MTARDSVRSALGWADAEQVAFIFHESAGDWEFRRCIPEILGRYHRVVVFPATPNARRQLAATNPELFESSQVMVVDSMELMPACDELMSVRFVEELAAKSPIPLRLLDVAGRWLAGELSQPLGALGERMP